MSATPDPGFEDTALSGESFATLAELEEESAWFRSRNALIELMIRRHFGNCRSLLEIGCGTGFVLSHLERAFPQMRLVGCELGGPGVEIARQRLERTELLELDAREMPFAAEFDLVCAFA